MAADNDRGSYLKYNITSYDNPSEIKTNKFVLSPESDPAALSALATYAGLTKNTKLAIDLEDWIQRIKDGKVTIIHK